SDGIYAEYRIGPSGCMIDTVKSTARFIPLKRLFRRVSPSLCGRKMHSVRWIINGAVSNVRKLHDCMIGETVFRVIIPLTQRALDYESVKSVTWSGHRVCRFNWRNAIDVGAYSFRSQTIDQQTGPPAALPVVI